MEQFQISATPASAHHGYPELESKLQGRFALRLCLLSPPRTGSTVVARILWSCPSLTHHCHEPFEACYWGGAGIESVAKILEHPMRLADGARVDLASIDSGGLLIKEMTFQSDETSFAFLTRVTNRPLIFVMRDPRLSATSRLRIVKELKGADTFPPFEGGWPSLAKQVQHCRDTGAPYVIVDSHLLRSHPAAITAELGRRLGLNLGEQAPSWQPRTELQLCAPEVGALMGEGRIQDDPFYRRVLASTGIQQPDPVDFEVEERLISAAGLTAQVGAWLDVYRHLGGDANVIRPPVT